MNTNDIQPAEGLQPWRDENGNLDLDVLRSGNYDIADADEVRAALLDEVERARTDRVLLDAVLDAIDLPIPATEGDTDAYRELLETRTRMALIAAKDGLDNPFNARVMVKFLAASVERTPAAYKVWGDVR